MFWRIFFLFPRAAGLKPQGVRFFFIFFTCNFLTKQILNLLTYNCITKQILNQNRNYFYPLVSARDVGSIFSLKNGRPKILFNILFKRSQLVLKLKIQLLNFNKQIFLHISFLEIVEFSF